MSQSDPTLLSHSVLGCESVPDRWSLEGFEEHLDIWFNQEQPDDDLRLIVTAWVLSRFDDPYQGFRRQPEFDNLWFGPIPGTQRGDQVVTCAYWIVERDHVVRCDSFATLGLPI